MRHWLAFCVFVLALSSCFGDGSGLHAWMRVPGGQYFEGTMPEADGGPEVLALRVSTHTIIAGQRGKPIDGSFAPSATGYAIGLAGDTGYWVLPAELPNAIEPEFPSFSVTADFSRALPDGEYEIIVRASDEDGLFGPAAKATVTASTVSPEALLVVSLRWANDADLDLHVVDPNGIEIFKGNINSFQLPLPGEPPAPPGAAEQGGILDFDSNAGCVVDGRAEENVVWQMEAPRGRYIARVDTYSLCDEPSAEWTVEVWVVGERVAVAAGLATTEDELAEHDPGRGVLALEFEVP